MAAQDYAEFEAAYAHRFGPELARRNGPPYARYVAAELRQMADAEPDLEDAAALLRRADRMDPDLRQGSEEVAVHHARITLTGHGKGEIHLDDQPIAGVRSIKLGSTVGEPNVLILELLVRSAEIDGEMVTVIPDDVAASLHALGWTAPEHQPGPDGQEVPGAAA